jgi:hypothetical protein
MIEFSKELAEKVNTVFKQKEKLQELSEHRLRQIVKLQQIIQEHEAITRQKTNVIKLQADAKNALLKKHEEEIEKLRAVILHDGYDIEENYMTIKKLSNIVTNKKKKAKKYKQMYKDARQANVKLSERLIELEWENKQGRELLQKLQN